MQNPVLITISLGPRSPGSAVLGASPPGVEEGGDTRVPCTNVSRHAERAEAGFVGAASLSYPCIHSDPGTILVNGQSMRGSIATPSLRLSNFDK